MHHDAVAATIYVAAALTAAAMREPQFSSHHAAIAVPSHPDWQELSRQIAEAVKAKQTGISLQTLLNFGRRAAVEGLGDTLNTSAHFLKRELPIRFAHRIVELDTLPHGLAAMPSIRRVCDWYKESFAEIRCGGWGGGYTFTCVLRCAAVAKHCVACVVALQTLRAPSKEVDA